MGTGQNGGSRDEAENRASSGLPFTKFFSNLWKFISFFILYPFYFLLSTASSHLLPTPHRLFPTLHRPRLQTAPPISPYRTACVPTPPQGISFRHQSPASPHQTAGFIPIGCHSWSIKDDLGCHGLITHFAGLPVKSTGKP